MLYSLPRARTPITYVLAYAQVHGEISLARFSAQRHCSARSSRHLPRPLHGPDGNNMADGRHSNAALPGGMQAVLRGMDEDSTRHVRRHPGGDVLRCDEQHSSVRVSLDQGFFRFSERGPLKNCLKLRDPLLN